MDWRLFITKLTSGRYYLTLIAGIILITGTFRGVFPADKVLDIVNLIVIFYFVRKTMDGTQGGKE